MKLKVVSYFEAVKVRLDLKEITVEGFLALTCLLGPTDEHIKSPTFGHRESV